MSSIASSHQSFLIPFILKPKFKTVSITSLRTFRCSCSSTSHNKQQPSPTKDEKKLAKLVLVALAAGVLTIGSVDDAFAAKTGGRIGGQSFRSSAPRSSPRINNNSRTNIYVNPRVAPPLVGGYGYGVPFYGGWGWSPFSFFAPGPGVAVGIGGGFDTIVLFMFLGAATAVVRKFFGSRNEDDDDDDY